MGLEGIVSKKLGSRYRSGAAKSWLKVKAFTEGEFVVIGTSRGDKAPVALLAAETEEGLSYAGAAMVTLAEADREIFWRNNEALKTSKPAIPMEPRKETSWLRPEMKVRVRHLKGEEMLRHATIQAATQIPSPGPSRRPAAATGAPSPEPSYPKPDMDREALRNYYLAIAPLMLPWIAERPLNLFRCPSHECFFQRNRNHPPAGDIFQPPIQSIPVQQKNGRVEDYLYVTAAAGIVAAVDAHAVEFHGWGSRISDIERPDRIAFDLDPDEGLPFELVKDAALQVRRSLDAIGLKSFAMLTGGKGIHVILPFVPELEWPQVRGFAKEFCEALASADPDRFTTSLPKAKRKGRIFLDYLRNQRTATAIMPWSARARPGLPVAAPVAWEELDKFSAASAFSVEDAQALLRRARSAALRSWGKADQHLPRL
jgi:bifunctional non-homologous end joining protein LigD